MATAAPTSSVILFCLMAISLGLLLPQSCMALDNILYTGDTLYAGESLVQGSYVFTMQTDCNLVLYDRSNPIWSSHTNGKGSRCRLRMQEDGNLVVYNDSNKPVWASNTGQGVSKNFVCVLQRDRNVVIYGPARWATGTNNVGTPGVIITADASRPAAADEPINPKIAMVAEN